jgi:hypothetical protein
MDPLRELSPERRICRRAVRTVCHAVALDDFRLLGERVLDMSPFGLLIACDDGVNVGEGVIVTFRVPGCLHWFDAEGKVARVVEGYREGDPGYCAGIRFTRIDLESRFLLRYYLRGLPPPVPARPLRRPEPPLPPAAMLLCA